MVTRNEERRHLTGAGIFSQSVVTPRRGSQWMNTLTSTASWSPAFPTRWNKQDAKGHRDLSFQSKASLLPGAQGKEQIRGKNSKHIMPMLWSWFGWFSLNICSPPVLLCWLIFQSLWTHDFVSIRRIIYPWSWSQNLCLLRIFLVLRLGPLKIYNLEWGKRRPDTVCIYDEERSVASA